VSDNLSDNYVTSDKARHQAIITYIDEYGEISAATAAKIIDRSPETARRVLAQLVRDGILVTVGANRNRKYQAKKT